MSSEMFTSPIKPASTDKEFISPEMTETSSPLSELTNRIATLTPGPIYYPEDSHSRRTPGIDRPDQIRSIGAFEHSFFGRKNLIQFGELDEPDLEFDDYQLPDQITIPAPHETFPFINEITQHPTDRGEYVSPGKNPHSRPFVPLQQQSPDLGSFGGSRSDLTEWVPPLRTARYPRSDPEFHPHNNQQPQQLRASGRFVFPPPK
jgi:hypothetical protein